MANRKQIWGIDIDASLALYYSGNGLFEVHFGSERFIELSYGMAAQKLGQCLMASLANIKEIPPPSERDDDAKKEREALNRAISLPPRKDLS